MIKSSILIFIILFIFLTLITNSYINAEDNINLEQMPLQRNEDISSVNLNSAAINSNICIVVENSGIIKASTDYSK